jgi:hypothetical protein
MSLKLSAIYRIQNPESNFEFEPGFREDQGAAAEPDPKPNSTPPTGYPLGMVLRACPDTADYAKDEISSWRDLIATANLVRGMTGHEGTIAEWRVTRGRAFIDSQPPT